MRLSGSPRISRNVSERLSLRSSSAGKRRKDVYTMENNLTLGHLLLIVQEPIRATCSYMARLLLAYPGNKHEVLMGRQMNECSEF